MFRMRLLLSSSGSTENEGNKLLRNADIYQSTRCHMPEDFDLHQITIRTSNFTRHSVVTGDTTMATSSVTLTSVWNNCSRQTASHFPGSRKRH